MPDVMQLTAQVCATAHQCDHSSTKLIKYVVVDAVLDQHIMQQ
jgi:hypothetical protein